jgi:hypothetical protein
VTCVGANVIKVQLVAGRSAHKDSTSELDYPGLVGLTTLEVGEFGLELANVVGNMELNDSISHRPMSIGGIGTRYLVRVRLALCVELVYGPRSDLEVLSTSVSVHLSNELDSVIYAPG